MGSEDRRRIELSIEGHHVRIDSRGRIEIEPDAAERAREGGRRVP